MIKRPLFAVLVTPSTTFSPLAFIGQGEAANRPIHTLMIAVLGVPLVDNGYFEDAAREAA